MKSTEALWKKPSLPKKRKTARINQKMKISKTNIFNTRDWVNSFSICVCHGVSTWILKRTSSSSMVYFWTSHREIIWMFQLSEISKTLKFCQFRFSISCWNIELCVSRISWTVRHMLTGTQRTLVAPMRLQPHASKVSKNPLPTEKLEFSICSWTSLKTLRTSTSHTISRS